MSLLAMLLRFLVLIVVVLVIVKPIDDSFVALGVLVIASLIVVKWPTRGVRRLNKAR